MSRTLLLCLVVGERTSDPESDSVLSAWAFQSLEAQRQPERGYSSPQPQTNTNQQDGALTRSNNQLIRADLNRPTVQFIYRWFYDVLANFG